MAMALSVPVTQSLHQQRGRTPKPITRLIGLLLLTLSLATIHAMSIMKTKPDHEPSELFSQLKRYEVISIDSEALHTAHPQSIALGGQQTSNEEAVRLFSKRISMKFQSTRHHRLHTESISSEEEVAATAASKQPKIFNYELSRMDDLFHPDYSQTQQYWENGVRKMELESVKYLHEIENCYYRGHQSTSNNYLTIHTCFGGFSGFIREDDAVWLIEPAHLHLPQAELQAHVNAFQAQKDAGADDSSATSKYGAEPTHASHVHLLFRLEDLHNEHEFMCTVGMSDADRAEYLATGKLPTHIQEHDHEGHSHQSHIMSVDQSKSTSASSAYSTFLSAREVMSSYDKSIAETILDQDEKGAANKDIPYSRRSMQTEAVQTYKYVEELIVNDNARYLLKGVNTEVLTAGIMATIKTTYEATTKFSPPIEMILIGQITWINQDPYTVSHGTCSACTTNNGASVDELLKTWNAWRSNVVNVQPYIHDNGHLFSGFTFEIPTLGYAGVGAMCSNSISGGIESMRDASDFRNAMIAAHEMGHNFGMNHDSTSNPCAPSGQIMNAVLTSNTPTNFSTCSITYEVNWFATTHPTCLDNIPTKQYGNAVCGNGFVEHNETCDCGNTKSCQVVNSRDPCCNATTCTFIEGATCSGALGCCDNCQVVQASAQKVCRPAANSCDLPEICPGPTATSDGAACPTDLGAAAGTTCSAGQYGPGLCYLNQCFSYLQQCRTGGANFPGAPFDTCSQQADLNEGNYCGTMWCSSTPGQCTFFRQSGNIIAIADGVPCPDSDNNLVWQCKGGTCVNPDELNQNYAWNSTGFPTCTICTDYQYQNISCYEKATGNLVPNGLCAPSSQPPTSQLCVNEAAGCYGDSGADSDIVNLFGWIQFSRKTAIFATLGFLAAFFIVIGCCYHAVTFQSDAEELPISAAEKKALNEKEAGLGTSSSKKKSGKVHQHIHVHHDDPRAQAAFAAAAQQQGTGSVKKKQVASFE